MFLFSPSLPFLPSVFKSPAGPQKRFASVPSFSKSDHIQSSSFLLAVPRSAELIIGYKDILYWLWGGGNSSRRIWNICTHLFLEWNIVCYLFPLTASPLPDLLLFFSKPKLIFLSIALPPITKKPSVPNKWPAKHSAPPPCKKLASLLHLSFQVSTLYVILEERKREISRA